MTQQTPPEADGGRFMSPDATLWREIDALGGAAYVTDPYSQGHNAALCKVLAILERRGFFPEHVEFIAADLTYARAEATHYANLLTQVRDQLALFVEELEDEGDRVYLGSTNHADYLRETEESLRYLDWERIEMAAQGRDLFAELRARNVALTRIDQDAPANEPSAVPTVGFQPSPDPEQDDGNDVVREAFAEGYSRGLWEAAIPAREALQARP